MKTEHYPECADSFAEKILKEVFAPVVAGVPPINGIHDLMLLPDGEIRHYGFRGDFRNGNIRNIFISSPDHGLSWVEHESAPNSPGATVRSPWSGDYLTVLCKHGHPGVEEWQSIHDSCPAHGIYVHRSGNGPDGPFVSHRIGDLLPRLLMPRQPLALRSRRRWILPAQAAGADGRNCPLVFRSDDDGHSWEYTALPAIPLFGLRPPHAGMRWENCGTEPTVAELGDGRLYMLIRTAHDQFWQSWSLDGGDSWSEPAPSRFYGTITTPLLFHLSDGRLLACWNNTTPLPEVNHDLQAGLGADERAGVWEDVFTNRDALHAAVSDNDGRDWVGFRELHLNERRNDIDFRSHGGNDSSLDKSIHQSQAVELPGGKVLLAFGQHADCRRMILFDPDWLYETDRREDFRCGLGAWSYQSYLKGVAGGFRGFTGHCSLNRRPGVAMVPHPDGEMREVLRIARHPDERLLEERQGAVWNFPAGFTGKIRLKLRQPDGAAGTKISLVDRWFNPTDPVVADYSMFVLSLDSSGRINGHPALKPDCWHWLTIRWNLEAAPAAAFSVDEGPQFELPLCFSTINGISYLHLQSAATEADPQGIMLELVEKTGPAN